MGLFGGAEKGFPHLNADRPETACADGLPHLFRLGSMDKKRCLLRFIGHHYVSLTIRVGYQWYIHLAWCDNWDRAPRIGVIGQRGVCMRFDPEMTKKMANSLEIMQNVEYLLSRSVPLSDEQMNYIALLRAEHEKLNEQYQELRAA